MIAVDKKKISNKTLSQQFRLPLKKDREQKIERGKKNSKTNRKCLTTRKIEEENEMDRVRASTIFHMIACICTSKRWINIEHAKQIEKLETIEKEIGNR